LGTTLQTRISFILNGAASTKLVLGGSQVTRRSLGGEGQGRIEVNGTRRKGSFDHLRLEETIGFLLSDTTRTMTRAFTKKIAMHGIGMGIFQFLRILWEEDGLTQSALAARARMKGPSAVAAIKELEWRGFVRRVDDRHDRRKVRLFLTSDGRQLYDLVMPDIEAIRQIMMVGFSGAEQEHLKQMLRRMRHNLSPEHERPRLPVRTLGAEGPAARVGRTGRAVARPSR
jgi:DNA-binding MarR family transcriptional regulator